MKTEQVIQKEKSVKLIKDLINTGHSRNQILDTLNWSSRKLTMFAYRHKLKIPRYTNIFPTDEQTQVIIGSLLGDGCVSYSGKNSKNCRLQISHSITQLDYLKYKYNILESLCNKGITIRNRTDKRFKNPEYQQCELKTKSLKVFTHYRKRWYSNNIKSLKGMTNVLDLNALGLAIWFMDDGNKAGNSCMLNTQGFQRDEVIYLQWILQKNFSVLTNLRKDNSIYIKQKSYKTFINQIKPYIIDSMLYKISPQLKKSGELSETPEVDNTEPS